MPRGSKPGERRGGRQRGTPNKKTALRNAAIAAAAANPDISPLDFLLGLMRDPNLSLELRIRVAQTAAPFIHGKPRAAGSIVPSAGATSIHVAGGVTTDPVLARALRDDCDRLGELLRKRYSKHGGSLSAAEEQEESGLRARVTQTAKAIGCPVGYGAAQARKDNNRLHQLYCKRISPPSCGGGALPDAEDAEEAHLRARVEAYEQSPEGVARRRILDLVLKRIPRGLSPAEQRELDELQALYPDPPLDPDDPMHAVALALEKSGHCPSDL
jgi:hypothetical protein